MDSILNKRDELLELIENKSPSIILITETMPKNIKGHVDKSELEIKNYDLFINENPVRGVAIYTHQSLQAKRNDKLSDETAFKESVWCSCRDLLGDEVLFGCIYRSSSASEENNDNLKLLLKHKDIVGNRYSKIFIAGDFNYPTINWNGVFSNNNDESFIECLRDCFLVQLVDRPTRYRSDQKPNILDLIITNDENFVYDISYNNPIGKSDHVCIEGLLAMNYGSIDTCGTGDRYCFKLANFGNLKKEVLSWNLHKWEDLNMEDHWTEFKENLLDAINKHIPKVKVKKQFTPKSTAWMDANAKRALTKKRKYFNKFKKHNTKYSWNKYVTMRNNAHTAVKEAKRNMEIKVSRNCKSNPKIFWSYVNSKLSHKQGVGTLKDKDGKEVSSNVEKANVLNNFFSSVFIEENTTDIPKIEHRHNGVYLCDIRVTPDAVKEKLNNLNVNKSAGPDNLPTRVLKELSNELCVPICNIINKSFESGVLPTEWKTANITAIYKKGNKSDPGNYRPISLTSIICKVTESFLRDTIQNHMENSGLFNNCQYGFRSNRSCTSQLLHVINDMTKAIESKDSMDVIYFDFQKAFDTVPHERLLSKLESYGISGNIKLWIKNFLNERKQRVVLKDSFSHFHKVISGVPQGSILGPTLFLIYINDLPDKLKNIVMIFADDTKLYGNTNQCDIIQEDINSMCQWSEKWLLGFNASKCKVMHIGNDNPKHSYFMTKGENASHICETNEEKDLGVTFDPSLKFDIHISNIVKKASKILGIIKRTFKYLEDDTLTQLYKSMIRPILEYANLIWHPLLKRQSVLIEAVQRRATKLIKSMFNLSYKERLRALKLPSLKYRRIRADLIEMYKILHNMTYLNKEALFPRKPYDRTRGHEFKVVIEFSSMNVRRNCFPNRTIKLWNKLSSETVNASNLTNFKIQLDAELHNLMFDFD